MDSIEVCEVSDLRLIVDRISKVDLRKRNIITLQGDLGAGKTAFVKYFMQEKYGFQDVNSPTFSVVNEYRSQDFEVYHFDLYRLDSLNEIEDMGFWDYLDHADWVFIEWPEKIADLLPEDQVIRIDITLNLKGCREFSIY